MGTHNPNIDYDDEVKEGYQKKIVDELGIEYKRLVDV